MLGKVNAGLRLVYTRPFFSFRSFRNEKKDDEKKRCLLENNIQITTVKIKSNITCYIRHGNNILILMQICIIIVDKHISLYIFFISAEKYIYIYIYIYY